MRRPSRLRFAASGSSLGSTTGMSRGTTPRDGRPRLTFAALRKAQGPKPRVTSDHDPSSGFVYERVPHVSAAKLAYDHPPSFTMLVDQPRKKRGWKRLGAPFTVESHSPWRYEPVVGGSGQAELRLGVRERVLRVLGQRGICRGRQWFTMAFG